MSTPLIGTSTGFLSLMLRVVAWLRVLIGRPVEKQNVQPPSILPEGFVTKGWLVRFLLHREPDVLFCPASPDQFVLVHPVS